VEGAAGRAAALDSVPSDVCTPRCHTLPSAAIQQANHPHQTTPNDHPPHQPTLPRPNRWQDRPKPQLHARAYLRLGLYQWHIHDTGLDGATIQRCLGLLKSATEYGANWAKAWHNWSLFNCGVLESLAKAGEPEAAAQYVAPAVQGFFRRCVCVGLGGVGGIGLRFAV